ncbi:MAG: class I SAM-dependent RNA methyltransferase [Bradyrhizobiaceae bacterium]|nr:class I SAM-dependent RNA methyltransferase [Bradyrhizobiaceae bacterium]
MKQQIERLRIERLGHRGDGIAETAEGPVYVPYSLPGETVEVERKGDRAEIVSIVEPSPDRVEPICPHFGTCGGCAVQHWREENYRAWKRDLAVTALAQAGVEAAVDDLIDAHGEGRRRAVLHAKRGGRKVLVVGFTGRRSHIVVPIDQCPIFAPPLDRALAIAWRLAEPLEPGGKPLDLHFTATDGGLDVDIRGSGPVEPDVAAALAAVAREERLARVTRHGELVAQLTEPFLKIGKATVVPPPGTFLQPTAAGEKALADLVLEAVGNARRIADLFSGIGTFALRLAENAQVLAVDSDEEAIAALNKAKGAPGLRPIETVTRDLFRSPLTAGELVPSKVVVLDPPRQGAEAQTKELAISGATRIVYVSCNPGTFARDARILVDNGWKSGRIVPVDQFRYSDHVELVGVFDR